MRGRVVALLGGLRRREAEASQSAASIASLVGGRSPAETLRVAAGMFRVLPFAKLRAENLESNVAADDLRQRTEVAALGSCDAFLSQ